MKVFDHILFKEEGHQYVNTNTGNTYTSVTTKIKEYEPVFRSRYWSIYKVLKNEGYKLIPDGASFVPSNFIMVQGEPVSIDTLEEEFGDKAKALRQEWESISEKALKKGNFIHLYMEMRARRKQIPVPSEYKDLQDVMEGYFDEHKPSTIDCELVIGDDETNIAGQIDYLREPYFITDYKGLCLNTPIPTENGFKSMGDIKVGDVIFDGKGELTKVNSVSKIHHKPCYKITFSDNESIVADFEHKWEVIEGVGAYQKNVELTTEELHRHYQENSSKNKLKIKNCDFTKSNYKDLPIDPYVLGLWLGDGSKYTGRITCIYDSI
jgi:hypothetical protein